MGIEYQEFRVKIRNKKTKEIIQLKRELLVPKGKLPLPEDFEFVDLDVVYG